jgi:hypothetical protein
MAFIPKEKSFASISANINLLFKEGKHIFYRGNDAPREFFIRFRLTRMMNGQRNVFHPCYDDQSIIRFH